MHNIITTYIGIKPELMQLKLKQVQYESGSWKRMLCFMIDENILLKNRLSEVLKDPFDHNLLEQLETFQSGFIKEDELVNLLRNELFELEKLMVKEGFESGSVIKEVHKKTKKLRKNILTVEKEFGKLKLDFNNYLSENI